MRRSATPSTRRTRRGRTPPTRSLRPLRPRPRATDRMTRTGTECWPRYGATWTRSARASRCFGFGTPSTASRTAAARSPIPRGCIGRSAGGSTASAPCSAPRTGPARPRSTTPAPAPGSRSNGSSGVGAVESLIAETMRSFDPRPVPEKFIGDVIVTPELRRGHRRNAGPCARWIRTDGRAHAVRRPRRTDDCEPGVQPPEPTRRRAIPGRGRTSTTAGSRPATST